MDGFVHMINLVIICTSYTHSNEANLVLQHTVERIFIGNSFADIDRGIFIVRGENVVLLGEIVLDY